MKEKVRLINVTLAIAVPENEFYPTSFCVDAVNEILREEQRDWAPESVLLDYQIARYTPTNVDAENYKEGDAFNEPQK